MNYGYFDTLFNIILTTRIDTCFDESAKYLVTERSPAISMQIICIYVRELLTNHLASVYVMLCLHFAREHVADGMQAGPGRGPGRSERPTLGSKLKFPVTFTICNIYEVSQL